MPISEEPGMLGFQSTYPFTGQMGPVYAFSDTLTPEQIKGIYSLGPSYMYSFVGDQSLLSTDDLLLNGILSTREGLSSKIIFGLNAQVRCFAGFLFLVLFIQVKLVTRIQNRIWLFEAKKDVCIVLGVVVIIVTCSISFRKL